MTASAAKFESMAKENNTDRDLGSLHLYAVIASELDGTRRKYEAAQNEAREVAQQLIRDITQTISLRELSRRLAKSPTYISQISTGKVAVSDHVFLMMANVFKELSDDAN